MPLSMQEIKEHYDQYGLHDMSVMPTAEYRQALADGALFWADHHDFVRSTLSGEIFATNKEQLDAMIEHLMEYRDRMPTPPEWLSEEK
ncbi:MULTISPECIES: hypothetical protein [Enterobacteriaceae]|uniref:hypothetical protein n=1 Tax=Enterobacteriaceae TaxID=543 RepID=UPI001392CE7F|nr:MULTISPECIES: hypothetical protein [Enterobacteriaceae]ELY2853714.1 hypothetical protein [Cronobacter dublinensis]ELY3451411.1 hypothetical protein [Cronobacter sakazakii]KAB1492812.1 hypothetical protein FZI16_01440 [Cronobacter sakazakii]MBY5254868.1 hypothetical protein [Citrobacter amalonaticus]MEB8629422.1 hypothetical protein [Cronobacter sakazakii]